MAGKEAPSILMEVLASLIFSAGLESAASSLNLFLASIVTALAAVLHGIIRRVLVL